MNASRLIYSMRRHSEPVMVYHKITEIADTTTGHLQKLYRFKEVRHALIPKTNVVRVTESVKGTLTHQSAIGVDVLQVLISTRELNFDLKDNDLIRRGTQFYKITDYEIQNGAYICECVKLRDSEEPLEDTMSVGPDSTYGESAGETIAVNDLVFQNQQDLYLATSADATKPAVGIVTDIVGSVIYSSRLCQVDSLVISGTPAAGSKSIYLGIDGACTFTAPSVGISQVVGFATALNTDSTYQATINLDSNIVSL